MDLYLVLLSSLIEIGKKTIKYLDLEKIDLVSGNFLNYNFNNTKFDIIFSFANHSTYDKGIVLSEDYFDKCNNLLGKNGKLLIESHHPNYENKDIFTKLVDKIKKKYNYREILHKTIKINNSFYDNERIFVILQK
jgi:ubiquinone/menaquinone biosynthesis C-methylase UbiE